jgi:hypothetical protein
MSDQYLTEYDVTPNLVHENAESIAACLEDRSHSVGLSYHNHFICTDGYGFNPGLEVLGYIVAGGVSVILICCLLAVMFNSNGERE